MTSGKESNRLCRIGFVATPPRSFFAYRSWLLLLKLIDHVSRWCALNFRKGAADRIVPSSRALLIMIVDLSHQAYQWPSVVWMYIYFCRRQFISNSFELERLTSSFHLNWNCWPVHFFWTGTGDQFFSFELELLTSSFLLNWNWWTSSSIQFTRTVEPELS